MDRLDQWQPARMRGFRPWLAPGASPSGDSGHHFQIQEHGKGEEYEGKLPWGSPQPGGERRERSRGRPLSLCKNRGWSDWRGRSEQWCGMTSSVEWRGSEQRAPCIGSWRWSARLGSGALVLRATSVEAARRAVAACSATGQGEQRVMTLRTGDVRGAARRVLRQPCRAMGRPGQRVAMALRRRPR
jgi:hypothetical protein